MPAVRAHQSHGRKSRVPCVRPEYLAVTSKVCYLATSFGAAVPNLKERCCLMPDHSLRTML